MDSIMVIETVFDRIEDDNAVLLSEGIELTIPVDAIEGICHEGETLLLDVKREGTEVLFTVMRG